VDPTLRRLAWTDDVRPKPKVGKVEALGPGKPQVVKRGAGRGQDFFLAKPVEDRANVFVSQCPLERSKAGCGRNHLQGLLGSLTQTKVGLTAWFNERMPRLQRVKLGG